MAERTADPQAQRPLSGQTGALQSLHKPSIGGGGGRPGGRGREKERENRVLQQANCHGLLGRSGDRLSVEYKFRNPGNLKKEIEESKEH